ncbi:hypothetical protein MRB53_010534 [Persea americana]|uniref:Uncharacterized protein n=1 Tax=Persea americana TaxID=3435 RepID=A0ACC2LS56_PERAE|nr:hypothetical protein MRB53_010534 [Persea americana]
MLLFSFDRAMPVYKRRVVEASIMNLKLQSHCLRCQSVITLGSPHLICIPTKSLVPGNCKEIGNVSTPIACSCIETGVVLLDNQYPVVNASILGTKTFLLFLARHVPFMRTAYPSFIIIGDHDKPLLVSQMR